MDVFHWIVVPISTVLGLAFARVLSGYVVAFKSRDLIRFDWLPLVLAGLVLAEGLQFWWALLELSSIKTWSLGAFTLLLAMVMLVFTAAALVTPTDAETDLRRAFEHDGRWAFLALAPFHLLAFIANILFWGSPLLSATQAIILVLAALCVMAGVTRRRRVQEVATIAYAALAVTGTLMASVSTY